MELVLRRVCYQTAVILKKSSATKKRGKTKKQHFRVAVEKIENDYQ